MCCRSFLESRRSFRSAPDSRQPCGTISCLNCRRRNFMAAKKKGSRKSGGRKYGQAASKSVKSAIEREKKGTLKSGRGGKGGTVKSRKQAIAIGLSEARKKGAKVPKKKKAA